MSSFTLDDEAADSFYESGNGTYLSQTAKTAGPAVNNSGGIEQFEVDNSAVSSLAYKAYEYTDASRYTSLFDVNVSDVTGRICRASFPFLLGGILSPPPAPKPAPHPPVLEESTGHSEELGEILSDGEDELLPVPAASPEAVVTSVESCLPFNDKPDLYGPVWLSFTLIIAVSAGANAYAVLQSILRGHDPLSASRLSGTDFYNFATAASYVWTFLAFSCTAVVVLKRYLKDPESCTTAKVVCVYGYSLAPLVPAVLLCALSNSLCWVSLGISACISATTVLINLWPKTSFMPAFLRMQEADTRENEGSEVPAASYGSPSVTDGWFGRSPVFWLRFGVVWCHMLAGFILKLRFF